MPRREVVSLVLAILLIVCVITLTEVTVRLKLLAIVMLLPFQALLVVAIGTGFFCLACLGFLLWRTKLRFTTKSLFAICILVAWPASRFASEIAYERERETALRVCLDSIVELAPQGDVFLCGRLRDGNEDLDAIQRSVFFVVCLFLNQNEVPYHITQLADVDLSGTEANDSHLRLLAATERIRILDLSRTKITDSGLEFLSRLRSLHELRLQDTLVSDEAVEKLQRALPDTKIVR